MNDTKKFKSYANSFQTVINLGLERIRLLLELMGNPHKKMKYIHIAGTNAKGSVCAFLQASLTHSGLKTGKYTSPNLIKVNERISIDGNDISDSEMTALLSEIEEKACEVEKSLGEYPSQFEIWTAMAFLYFKIKNCDIVILETGLGGRFDATNVIEENVMSIITKIALDHTEYLGDTVEKIAFEKCGIIKKNSIVVSARQEKAAEEVIKKRATEENNKLYFAKETKSGEFSDIYEKYGDVFLSLGGLHQLENASIAVTALKALGINEKSIEYGLTHAAHNARFELISKNPPVIFDGGHNPDGIASLKSSLLRYYGSDKKIFVCAFMKDKDIKSSLELIKPLAEEICFTRVKGNERSASEKQLFDIADSLNIKHSFFENAGDAVNYSLGKNRTVVICGSLYLYKDIKENEKISFKFQV